MNYDGKFKDIVKYCKENNLYIGTGNPNAKILIIGKECAINKESEQFELEIKNNPSDWKANLTEVDYSKYNPLYPYKGQKCVIERRSKSNRNIISGKGGTSATWYYYQKLFNQICPKHANKETINFHEHCFITELNEATAKTSKDVREKERNESIQNRKELLKEEFFQHFRIVIVACGPYVRKYDIDLQKMFNVDFISPTKNVGSKWLNIHKGKGKILIHTNQFSMVSNALIEAISKECQDFIK